MAEYIESTKMADVIHRYFVGYKVEDMILDIRKEAIADVAPVVHGRWIRYHEADLGWDEYGYRCSECKMEIEDKDFWDMFNKRCPNCGARMDGE